MSERITCEIFKDAACELNYCKTREDFKPEKVRACKDALEFLLDNKSELTDAQKYVDAALHHIYPGLGKTDLPELNILLREEIEIIKKVMRRPHTVTDPEFDQVINFCQKMWVQLSLKERGQEPHIGWEVSGNGKI